MITFSSIIYQHYAHHIIPIITIFKEKINKKVIIYER